jgi:Skp family chaperone for outer membrane proteins
MISARLLESIITVPILGVVAFAQTGTGTARPAGAASPNIPRAAAGAAPSKGKIAFVNSAELQEKLTDYKAKIDELGRQFEPRIKELQTLNERAIALENTIKAQGATLTPAKVAEMTEQLESMKREVTRKQEDLQADGDRARNQQMAPLKEKLQKFLQDFTTRHGITLLVDLSNAVESNTVLWFDQRADVTQQFIAEYNQALGQPAAGKK